MAKFVPYNNSIKTFSRLALDGEISLDMVVPMACILDAVRNAQFVAGPGHLPIGVVLDSVPLLHIDNYLKERRARH